MRFDFNSNQFLYITPYNLSYYLIKKQLGPDHDPSFVVRVMISGDIGASGSGKSLKLAEQKAANNLLKKLYSKE